MQISFEAREVKRLLSSVRAAGTIFRRTFRYRGCGMHRGHNGFILLLVIGLIRPLGALGHDTEDEHHHDDDAARARTFLVALEKSRAQITVKNGYRYISSNGLPDHE